MANERGDKKKNRTGGAGRGSGKPGGNNGFSPPTEGSRTEKLEYIRQMLVELRRLADDLGEGTLIYIVEMAALEAEECWKRSKLGSRLTG